MEGGSVLEFGQDIIDVMAPASVCMFLVVLLVCTVYNPSSSAASNIRTAANLVYMETPTDSTAQKFEGAILNAVVFVVIIALVTFLLLLLYRCQSENLIMYYTCFSVFMIFSAMGGSVLISVVQRFNIPVDAVTFCILLFNFTILGTIFVSLDWIPRNLDQSTISVSLDWIPRILNQSTMVVLGIIVAAWFSRLPDWTTWVLLVALALYDLAAVLAPGGPLNMLAEMKLLGLVYKTRPNVGRNSRSNSSWELFFKPGLGMSSNDNNNNNNRNHNNNGSLELQERNGDNVAEIQERQDVIIDVDDNGSEIEELSEEGEMAPFMGDDNLMERRSQPYRRRRRRSSSSDGTRLSRANEREGNETKDSNASAIELGMGDFIFYGVLVGRAAMFDLMTVYASYLAIISGLGCTLVLLAVYRKPLPALTIPIASGVVFYFLTRLFMEPFAVGASTNLMMF